LLSHLLLCDIAIFNKIIGGDMQIIAQSQGASDASQAIILTINEPTTVQVKMAKYVSIGGLLVQASNHNPCNTGHCSPICCG
jgi:hypothetical protein